MLLNAPFTMDAAGPLGPGDHLRTLEHDGRTRTYLVHIPPRYEFRRPTPLVFALHGGGSNAETMLQFCGLNEKADEEVFLVAYPNGTGRVAQMLTWNGGNCCAYAMRNKVDDVGFIRSILDDLAGVASVDPRRVFATGMSNGGVMCYRLASELSDRIAAIAAVAGTMGAATCHPARPVPVMHFHGTNDAYLPFHGGKGLRRLTQTHFYSVPHSISAWARANDCPQVPIVTGVATKFDDGTSVQRQTYGPGKDGAEVVLFVIHGGGHTWPGRQTRIPLLGPSTRNISANELMWEFFQRHPIRP